MLWGFYFAWLHPNITKQRLSKADSLLHNSTQFTNHTHANTHAFIFSLLASIYRRHRPSFLNLQLFLFRPSLVQLIAMIFFISFTQLVCGLHFFLLVPAVYNFLALFLRFCLVAQHSNSVLYLSMASIIVLPAIRSIPFRKDTRIYYVPHSLIQN